MKTIGFCNHTTKQKRFEIPITFCHIMISGNTGSGKTSSILRPLLRQRMEQGHAILFYAYKGHEQRYVKHIAKELGRLEDIVEIGVPFGTKINLLDNINKKKMMNIFQQNGSKDPYWEKSAARLIGALSDILYALHPIIDEDNEFYGSIRLNIERNFLKSKKVKKYFYPKPSIASLAQIISSPKTFKEFLSIIKKVKTAVEKFISDDYDSFIGIYDRFEMAKILKTSFLAISRIENIEQFTFSDDTGENSGNNGVMQVAYNILMDIAAREFFNVPEANIYDLLEQRKIVIIDLESLSSDVHTALLDSLLEKIALRVKKRSIMPITIFIDEANRVLSGETEIYNDVLREAKCELIVAFQNEEQMMQKFGPIKWESIKLNFLYKLHMNDDHTLYWNDQAFSPTPYVLPQSLLEKAESDYYNLSRNRAKIENSFVFEKMLPKSFIMEYDIKKFEESEKLCVRDLETNELIQGIYINERLSKKWKESKHQSTASDFESGVDIKSVFHMKSNFHK